MIANRDARILELAEKLDPLTDSRMRAAFEAVPRHLFLPDVPLEKVYADEAIPVKYDDEGAVISSSSQPSMMALMLRQLQLRPGDNVLEIGTGTGYNAAIIQHIVGESGNVTSIELDQVLAQQANDNLLRAGALASKVKVVQADGASGYQPRASYDRIIATAAVWDIPAAWVQQLKTDGILVAPILLDGLQVSAAFRVKPDGTLYSEHNIPCGFVELRGTSAGPGNIKRVLSSSLTLLSDELNKLDTAALHVLLSDDYGLCNLDYQLTSTEYWQGFMPYLMLNEPVGFTFALYVTGENQKAYGLEDSGFALIAPGSASFVPYGGHGVAHCYAGADAFIALCDAAAAWDAAGRPTADALRLRLVPLDRGEPTVKDGKLYRRQDHYLHIWLSQTDA